MLFLVALYPDDSDVYSPRAEKLVQSRDSFCLEPVDDYLEEAQRKVSASF